MKYLVTYLFIISFSWVCGQSFSQTPSVKPVKKEFLLKDTLSFVFDGVICNDGANKLNPVWGVLRRSMNGWDTIIHVRSRIMMKEIIPYTTFENYKRDFIVINNAPIMYTDDRLYPEELLFNNDGEYMLTVLSGDGKEVVYSEPFSISKNITMNTQLAKELKSSPDTVIIENHPLFLTGIFVWRDMMPIITNESSKMIAKGQLISSDKELLNGITLIKHYVVKDSLIWMTDFDEREVRKSIHRNYIEAVVRNGPLWTTNIIADVIWEFEYLGKTYRIIARSRLIGGVM